MKAWRKTTGNLRTPINRSGGGRMLALGAAALLGPAVALLADETCQSPYMAKITGQEEYVYVWTLGIEGVGDGSDKLVTVDVRPQSKTYGEVLHRVSVGGRHEAHHGGFTDDRRQLWVSGLDTSQIWIFDVRTDPARPKLVKTIDDFVEAYGQVVDRKPNPQDVFGPLAHTVRVYLIDRQGMVRNIYSFGLLDPRLLITDVRTLLLEEKSRLQPAWTGANVN